MRTRDKKSKKGMTQEEAEALIQKFTDDMLAGKIEEPFKEKMEQARKNLKKAGLID